MAIREHLLFGSEHHKTLVTGCGRVPEERGGILTVGAGAAHREKEFARLLETHPAWCCGTCIRSLQKVKRLSSRRSS